MAHAAAISRVAFQTGWNGEPWYRLDLSSGAHIYLTADHSIIKDALANGNPIDDLVGYDLTMSVTVR
jgi:hypothetical protein